MSDPELIELGTHINLDTIKIIIVGISQNLVIL